MDAVPIGTIVAWINKVDPQQVAGPLPVPNGWMKCDGSIVPHGLWSGLHVPDLNGEKRFLRGGEDRDVLKMEDHSIQEHTHFFEDPGHFHKTQPAAVDGFHGHEYDGNGDGGYIGNAELTAYTAKTNIKILLFKNINDVYWMLFNDKWIVVEHQ